MISGSVEAWASTVSSSLEIVGVGIDQVAAPGVGALSPPIVLSTKNPSVPTRFLPSADELKLPSDLSKVRMNGLAVVPAPVTVILPLNPVRPAIDDCSKAALML